MSAVRKGYCPGCPFNVGEPDTEEAYNLGCLPHTGELGSLCRENGTAWACHSEPDKVCCGHAARRNMPLQHMDGVHKIEVANWPKPRVSNPNFLSELLADWQADQKRP
jgi:hypothetical protein